MKQNKAKTPYIIALRDRILDAAMHAFITQGIKAVRMDDIAKTLGISKRTLYEIYENKEVLLFEGVKKYKAKNDSMLTAIYNDTPDVIDMLLKIYRLKVEEFNKVCPEFYSDLSKYPSVQEFFKQGRKQSHQNFIEFIKRGIKEGYFRSDMQLDLITHAFSSMMDHINQNQLYKTYTIEEIFHNIVFVSFRGFSTIQGIKRLDQY